jgi:outer membrane protein assembly factor BamA
LHNLGIFSRVEVRDVPSFRDPGLRNVIVQLEEAKRYTLLYGLGYSSAEGIRGTFGVSDLNFLGMARSLALGLRAGSLRQRANLSYALGRVLNWRLPTVFTLTADNEKAQILETDRQRRVIRGKPFDSLRLIAAGQTEYRQSARESLFFRADFQKLHIKLPSNLFVQYFREEENLRLTSLSMSYVNESRNDPANPSQGFLLNGEVLLSPRVLGSERQFFRLLTQGQYYRSLTQGVVWASSLRIGIIAPFGKTPALAGDNPTPISERFFSGGATTLRGLPQDMAGPLLRDPDTGEVVLVDDKGRPDPNGRPVPLGGNLLLIGNTEIRFPLVSRLSGALFYDAGNVFSKLTDLSRVGISHAVGFGLRANTPVGPVRFDLGYNPKPPVEAGFKTWNLHFTLGHPF